MSAKGQKWCFRVRSGKGNRDLSETSYNKVLLGRPNEQSLHWSKKKIAMSPKLEDYFRLLIRRF